MAIVTSSSKRPFSPSNFLLRHFVKGSRSAVYGFALLLVAFWVFVMNNNYDGASDIGIAPPRGLMPISTALPPQPRLTTQVCGAAVLPRVWTEYTRLDAPLLNPECPQPEMMMEPLTIPATPEKVVTFFIIYYNNADYLAQQLDSWIRQFSETAKKRIQFLIIDDGSAVGHRAVDFLHANQAFVDAGKIDLQVYEVDQDLVWNIGGARNLGFWVAPTEWVFLSDSDILVPPSTMDYVLELYDRSTPQTIFKNFYRRRADGITYKPHPAVMLITKKSYWKAGGCDEDFIGNYGFTDVHFFHRAQKMANSLTIEKVDQEMIDRPVASIEELPDEVTCPPNLKCLEKYHGVKPVKDPSINEKMHEAKITGAMAWAQDYMRFTWRRVW